jgi:hypothetical protein
VGGTGVAWGVRPPDAGDQTGLGGEPRPGSAADEVAVVLPAGSPKPGCGAALSPGVPRSGATTAAVAVEAPGRTVAALAVLTVIVRS